MRNGEITQVPILFSHGNLLDETKGRIGHVFEGKHDSFGAVRWCVFENEELNNILLEPEVHE
jgi:hypothetical protein